MYSMISDLWSIIYIYIYIHTWGTTLITYYTAVWVCKTTVDKYIYLQFIHTSLQESLSNILKLNTEAPDIVVQAHADKLGQAKCSTWTRVRSQRAFEVQKERLLQTVWRKEGEGLTKSAPTFCIVHWSMYLRIECIMHRSCENVMSGNVIQVTPLFSVFKKTRMEDI